MIPCLYVFLRKLFNQLKTATSNNGCFYGIVTSLAGHEYPYYTRVELRRINKRGRSGNVRVASGSVYYAMTDMPGVT